MTGNKYMLIFCLLKSVFFFASLTAGYQFDIDILGEYEYVENEIIIKLRKDASPQDISSIKKSLNAKQIQIFRYVGAEVWEINGIDARDAILRFRDHPAVAYIEPNLIIKLDVLEGEKGIKDGGTEIDDDERIIPNDPYFDLLWGMYNTGQSGGTPGADIDATRAWTIQTGDTLLIAIVDTGIDYDHPDLAPNMWENLGYNFIDPWSTDPMDGNSHGTHVAGTVAAVGDNEIGVAGVTWTAELMAVKIFDDDGNTSTSAIVNGVEYTVTHDVRISNHSWGGPFQQVVFEAFQETRQAGQLVVAAAGNHNANNDVNPRYPAAYPLDNIIAVAASDHDDEKASYSAWGPNTVHIAAPGGDIGGMIYSTAPDNSYAYKMGTSMASPHTAGAAALVWSNFPHWDYLTVKNHLMLTVDPITHWQEVFPVISGGRLNVYRALHEPDTIPPAPVTDLAIIELLPFSVALQWTASGASGDTGQASYYDIRYSTEPINEDNFNQATQVPDTPTPKQAGEPEEFTVTDLNPGTTYYFALKVSDMWLNWSDISNVVYGTTEGSPEIAVNPTEFNVELDVNGVWEETLNISNSGAGTLLFSLPGASLQIRLSDIKEGEEYALHVNEATGLGIMGVDPAVNNPAVIGVGGPDEFGNVWIDSHESGGPYFNWLDISEIGEELTELTGTRDGNTVIDIPFDYPFYGNEYDQARVSVNGWITFDLDYTGLGYINQEVPDPTSPNNLLAVYWDHLDMRTSGKVYKYHDEINNRFIIQWHEVPRTNRTDVYTFQAQIYPSGMVMYQYYFMDISDNTATVGIENQDGTDGLLVVFNTPYVEDELAVVFLPDQLPEWITVSPGEGSIPADEELDVNVTFHSADVTQGYYQFFILILSNDPDHAIISIPVRLIVDGDDPEIIVTPIEVDFDSVMVGGTAAESITIENTGLAFLEIENISVDENVFSLEDATNYIIPPFNSRNIQITFSPDEVGHFTGEMIIESNDPGNPIVTVQLSGTGIPSPAISVYPDAFEETLYEGETIERTLILGNQGWSDLEFSITTQSVSGCFGFSAPLTGEKTEQIKRETDTGIAAASVNWINLDIVGGSVNAKDTIEISVTFDATNLEPGMYHASIVVTSNDPINPEVAIPVELTVKTDLPIPDQVVLVYPEDTETIEVDSDELAVETGWYSSQPQVINYQIDIALDADFTDMVFTSDELADTFYVFMDPEDQQTYYWRVRAENETGWGEYSDVWSFTTLIVGVDDGREIPEVYSLMQNFPNPFNPSTVIRYGLPERSSVKLEIYNTLGQRVAVFMNAELEAGYHEVEWHSGWTASGMYFYRLDAVSLNDASNRFIQTRSMILLK